MKLLSIAVPSYNSQDYLHKCLDSLVLGGPDVEVIVVDDGSTDRTAEIGRDYVARYPDIVRLESKPNGGHGSAVNKGLEVATGRYFKVCDSDDWFDPEAYQNVLEVLREQPNDDSAIDLLIANYVYEYAYNNTTNVISYRNAFPVNRRFTWSEMRFFRVNQFLLMHSMIYRADRLRLCGLKLPEHTFYVDNIVAYQPLPLVRSIIYLNVDLYRYFIGRPDQSVNMNNMIKRIDQQLRITRIMLNLYNLPRDIVDRQLRRYMYRYLSMMVSIAVIHLILSKDEENLKKIDQLWQDIKDYDLHTYRRIRMSLANSAMSLPGRGGRYIARKTYMVARKIYKFN
ncbi:MAG: glycosyl transferase [Firmicutes bacterium]|nr:glycosyl transferase [Bacillota bacterium]